jgi:hypothetical protein
MIFTTLEDKMRPMLAKQTDLDAVKVAIHQPNYLPYIGFFQKMALVDVFVILDVVQFSKDSYTQRTKIRTKDGWIWLTIPIEKKYCFKPIRDIYMPQDEKWFKKHKMSIKSNYSKYKFIDDKFIDEYYSYPGNFKKLHEFNEYGIFYLKDKFRINTRIVRASELNIDEKLKSTDLLVDIVKKVEGDIYISGSGGKNYMDAKKFLINKIKLKHFEFKPIEYPQRWDGFEPYMSAIDLLFNVGEPNENMFFW